MNIRKLFIIAGILLLSTSVMAQNSIALSAYTGYSLSAFEDQESAAGSLPLGISGAVEVMPQLQVGGEVLFALGGYQFEAEFFGETITTTMNQNMVGVFGRYYIPTTSITPYGKLGLGYYFGDSSIEGFGAEEELDVDGAIGFNLGAGVLITDNIFAEFNYNIVSRESDGESFGANTWAILAGYRFMLGM